MKISKQSTSDAYPDINSALYDFQVMCGFLLDLELKNKVTALIKENGLSRRFVRDLATPVFDQLSLPGPVAGLYARCFDGRGTA